MSNPKDIIGIVKELQGTERSKELVKVIEKVADTVTVMETVPHFQYRNRVSQLFPLIAEALLIAVEALENLNSGGLGVREGGTFIQPHEEAEEALSRISSLSVE